MYFLRSFCTSFKQERYFGPFDEQETIRAVRGYFQTSPVSLVPKPNTNPVKFRHVNNLSSPLHPRSFPSGTITSINHSIDADNYPCTWGTFAVVALLIARLPPGSQGAVRDVSEAYRCIPSHPINGPAQSSESQTPFLLSMSHSSSDSRPPAASGVSLLMRYAQSFAHRAIAPLAKWVDDFIFFRILLSHLDDYNRRQKKWAERIRLQGGCRQTNSRIWFAGGFYPDGTIEEYDNDLSNPILPQASSIRNEHLFTYSLDDIDDITEPLGIPWSKPKEIPFCSRPEYIGFYWDIDKRMVGLTEKKKEKYRKAIDEWRTSSTHDLPETQKLYGKLLHAAHIIPAGRAYLTVFENFMGIFGDSPHMPRTPRKSIFADLDWWYERLSKPLSNVASQGPSISLTSTPTQMPAHPSESDSSYKALGEHGNYDLGGNQTLMEEILHGSKPLVSKYSSVASFPRYRHLLMSRFIATTKSLSKGGESAEVGTSRSIVSSNASINSAKTLNATSMFDTSKDGTIPQTVRPEEFTRKDLSSQSPHFPTRSPNTYKSLLRTKFENHLCERQESHFPSRTGRKKPRR